MYNNYTFIFCKLGYLSFISVRYLVNHFRLRSDSREATKSKQSYKVPKLYSFNFFSKTRSPGLLGTLESSLQLLNSPEKRRFRSYGGGSLKLRLTPLPYPTLRSVKVLFSVASFTVMSNVQILYKISIANTQVFY